MLCASQSRLEAEAARQSEELAALSQRQKAAAAEALRRQGRLAQLRAAVGWRALPPTRSQSTPHVHS